jgi:hypothetical protein
MSLKLLQPKKIQELCYVHGSLTTLGAYYLLAASERTILLTYRVPKSLFYIIGGDTNDRHNSSFARTRQSLMSATGDYWEDDGDFTESGIINYPLKEKTPVKVHWHGLVGGLETHPSDSV